MAYGAIYLHRNKINGKVYVGQTIRDPRKRWGKNGVHYLHGVNKYFKHSIEKHGWDNFEHIIVRECENQQELDEAEIAIKYGKSLG